MNKSGWCLCNYGAFRDCDALFLNVRGLSFVACVAILACIFGWSDSVSAATISMTTSGAQSIDVMPDNSSNVGTTIGVDNINVITDCKAGYNLSMSTSVSDNNLYLNGNNGNNQSGTYFSPANGTSTLANSPNTWGYLLSDTTPTSSSIFSAVPTSDNPAVLKTSASTASATNINDSFNVYFGVAMANNLTPGKYKMIPDINNGNTDGVITYYLTMDTSCEARTITYNANNGSGTIEPQIVQAGESVALADNAFTRTDYYFMGWSTDQSATTPEYRTNQDITPTGNMTLYAVWGSSTTTSLYDAVASLTKGVQSNDNSIVANTGNTVAGIQASVNKANSGVYTYDANIYGTASDAATTNPIYYYRGILDSTLTNYGTDGDAMNYPNYVRTGNLCWRIIRTTGSGGVKMIFNGIYGATSSSSCANSGSNSQAGTSAFNSINNINYNSIISAGYTFNNNYASTTSTTTAGDLFSTNSTFLNNSTRSTVKEYLEDTWYSNNMIKYTSSLEPSAGYCNDRSVYDGANNLLGDSASITTPYSTASSGVTQYYFGARVRNSTNTQSPSLSCPRGAVDLYGYEVNSTGAGNQLKKPVSLLTADEASFAGSGNAIPEYGSGYSVNSFLNSGATTLTLSPYYRNSDSNTIILALYSDGRLSSTSAGYTNSVRPVISFKTGTIIESGSGTSTSPWIIPEPTMQTATSIDCGSELKDARDENYYTTAMIGGQCWMTKNLDLPGGTTLNSSDSNLIAGFTLPTSSTSGFSSYNTDYVYNSNSTTCTSDSPCYSYYSFYTATAHWGTNDVTSGSSNVDICPRGWRLPVDSELLGASRSQPPLFNNIRAGRYDGNNAAGSFMYSGQYGFYWSSTSYAANSAFRMQINTPSSPSVGQMPKYIGYSIRCVAKE